MLHKRPHHQVDDLHSTMRNENRVINRCAIGAIKFKPSRKSGNILKRFVSSHQEDSSPPQLGRPRWRRGRHWSPIALSVSESPADLILDDLVARRARRPGFNHQNHNQVDVPSIGDSLTASTMIVNFPAQLNGSLPLPSPTPMIKI
jgi:hypothetical protein